MKKSASPHVFAILGILAISTSLPAQPPPEKTTLTGTVTDLATDLPVTSAKVSLQRIRERDEAVGYEGGETATDAAGGYRFAEVEEGRYTLSVSAPQYLSLTRQVKVGMEPVTEDVSLVPFSAISGRLLDLNGQPLADTAVCCLVPWVVPGEDWGPPGLQSYWTTTDAEGRYRLPDVAAGRAQCLGIVPQRGYGASARKIVPPGEEATDVDIPLQAGQTLRVLVREEGTGDPVPGQPVTVTYVLNLAYGPNWEATAYTLADGVGVFRGLPPGNYRVHLGERQGGLPEGINVLLFPDRLVVEKTFTIPQRSGWELTGRILGPDGVTPVRDTLLHFFFWYGGESPQTAARDRTATDADGEFRLRLSASAQMTGLVLVHAPGVGYAVTDPVTLQPEEGHNRLELQLDPVGRLEGVVRTAAGEPVANAVIGAAPANPRQLPLLKAGQPAITDLTGRFRWGDLLPGTYQVQVTHPATTPPQTVTVEPDRTATAEFTVDTPLAAR